MNLPSTCMNLYELSCPALYQCPSPLCDGEEAHGRWPGDAPGGSHPELRKVHSSPLTRAIPGTPLCHPGRRRRAGRMAVHISFISHHSEAHTYLWRTGKVLVVWLSLDASCHCPRSPGRVLCHEAHDIRAQNVAWNSIGGHGRPTGPVWTGTPIAPCVAITHCPSMSSSLGWSC